MFLVIISNANTTEWSPIRSVIIRVITDRIGIVYHEYTRSYNFREEEEPIYEKNGKFALKD